MKRCTATIALLFAFLITIVSSIDLANADKRMDVTLNKTMVEIGQTMEGLFPVLFDKEEPGKKQKVQLKNAVNKLTTLFDRAKMHIDTKSPTYGVSFSVIKTQLSHASSAIKYDNANYAKSILKDINTVCTSCHLQDLKKRILFPNVKRNSFDSDLEFAEFNYMTRNYDTAIEYFKKYLKSANNIEEAELLTVMKQMITVYIQIDFRPKEAKKLLNEIIKDVYAISEKIGKNEGYLMIIRNEGVKYSPDSIDITGCHPGHDFPSNI